MSDIRKHLQGMYVNSSPEFWRAIDTLALLNNDDLDHVVAMSLQKRRLDELAAHGIKLWGMAPWCPCYFRDPRGRAHQGTNALVSICPRFDVANGWQDHLRTWRRGRTRVALTAEPYGPVDPAEMSKLADALAADDLRLSICPDCVTHFPGSTIALVITRAEDAGHLLP
jgi:hypothetical protein